MSFVDLHVHSNASDGTMTPTEVVALAGSLGLSGLALTDHDTTAGISEALLAGTKFGVEVIPGIELSTEADSTEIHILGLFLDQEGSGFQEQLQALANVRKARNEEMLRRFQALKIPLTEELLRAGNPDTIITRAHFARALVSLGVVTTMDQAFRRFLEKGAPCYVPRTLITPWQAVTLLRENGAFPVLAHPMQYKLGWTKTEALICRLKEAGLLGLEVYYSSHTSAQSARLQVLAKRNGLLPTGGSDFHGTNKPDIHLGTGRGGLRVSSLLLEDIKQLRNAPGNT